MEYTQVPADTFEKLQMNAGIVLSSFTPATGAFNRTDIIGATTGGLSFASNPEFSDFGEDIDNVPNNTMQLKRITSFDPSLSGTFLTVSPASAAKLAGAASVDGTDTTKVVPRTNLTDADFNDIWFVGDYSDNNIGSGTAGFVAIHIKNALNTVGFQLTTSKNAKGQFAFEFHGHYDIEDIDDVPFEIYVKEGTPALASLVVTSVAGSTTGKSKITVSGYTLGSGESYVYQTGESAAPSVSYGDTVTGWTALTSGNDISPTSGHTKITVAVKDSNGKAVGAGSTTLVVAA